MAMCLQNPLADFFRVRHKDYWLHLTAASALALLTCSSRAAGHAGGLVEIPGPIWEGSSQFLAEDHKAGLLSYGWLTEATRSLKRRDERFVTSSWSGTANLESTQSFVFVEPRQGTAGTLANEAGTGIVSFRLRLLSDDILRRRGDAVECSILTHTHI